MSIYTLSVAVDTPEPRVTLDRLVGLVDGRTWDLPNSSGAGVELVNLTAFLAPAPTLAGWSTSNAGLFTRLRKADLSIAGSDHWQEYSPGRFDGDYYMHSLGVNEVVTTLGSWPKNKGFFLSWKAYNVGNDNFPQIIFVFGAGGTPTIQCTFYPTGLVEIYKAGNLVGTGNITTLSETIIEPLAYIKTKERGTTQQMANDTVDVLMIPYRKRELLFLSNLGGGFSFTFEDISEDDPDPTITGSGQASFYVPTGQATVQLAPFRCLSQGYLLSEIINLRYLPDGAQNITVTPYWDAPGYGTGTVNASLVAADGVTPFASAISQQCRIRIDLTSDGFSTPFVYGASVVFDRLTKTTPNSPTFLDDYLLKAELSVPESPSDVRMTFTVKSPADLENQGANRLRRISNRPVSAWLGPYLIFSGRNEGPRWKESVSDEARELVLECRDRWKALEKYLFQDPMPLDSFLLSDALALLVKLPGFSDSDMDIDYIDFPLPSVAQNSKGEWAVLPQVGDTAAEWIQRLWETYAQTYWCGWRPTPTGPKFFFKSPASLGTNPVITLYPTDQDAQDVGGWGPGSWFLWYTAYDEHDLEPEANDIYVTGLNPKTGLPLLTHAADYGSQKPDLAVSARPENWLGEPRRYGLVDPGITTIAAAARAAATLKQRLTPVRRMAEWDCQFLIRDDNLPVWRGDCVELYGKGLFRVTSLSGEFYLEHSADDTGPDAAYRPFKYTGEKIG
jgi:hypothetical protein